jgi:hypothetical protein
MPGGWRPAEGRVKCVHIERTSEGAKIESECLFRGYSVHIIQGLNNLEQEPSGEFRVKITEKTAPREFEARILGSCSRDVDSAKSEIENRKDVSDPDRKRKTEIRENVSSGYVS